MERKLLYTGLIIGGLAIAGGAFSRPVRKIVHERDRVDVWDGSEEHLEVAHISHAKTEIYNSETNGRLLSSKNHYIDHFNRHGNETLGLTEEANKWSLSMIWKRLTEAEKETLPPPEEVGKKLIPIVLKRKK